ncbi:MAG: c-type cytochrome [Alphaproteobacteria bacterium]
MFVRAAAIALLLPAHAAAEAPLAERLAGADVQRGERIVSKKCAAACHTYEKGGSARVGPNLWGVAGKPMARRAGYGYSPAMRERAAQGGKWDGKTLDAYLANPRKFLPGTSMTFVGLRKAQDRADVIVYLRSLSDEPEALPEEP